MMNACKTAKKEILRSRCTIANMNAWKTLRRGILETCIKFNMYVQFQITMKTRDYKNVELY